MLVTLAVLILRSGRDKPLVREHQLTVVLGIYSR